MRSLTRLAAIAATALAVAAGSLVAAAPASAGPTDDYSIAFGASDFGSVPEGSMKQITIEVKNDGKQPITIDTAALASFAYPFKLDSTTIKAGEGLDPGMTRELKVSFTGGVPATSVTTKIAFTVQSVITPGFSATYDLELKAASIAAVGPNFEVTDPPAGDALDFGQVELGNTATKSITIVNDGTVPLTFDSTAQTARDMKGNSVPVTFRGAPFTTVVAPGASTTFTLDFAPTAEGRLDGFITLVGSDGMASVTRIVEFTAMGVAAVVPTPTPTPTSNPAGGAGSGTTSTGSSTTGTSGRTLASTGADAAGLFAGASVALMLLVGGSILFVQRRRRVQS
ncbi:choice-of-anchor D domain-containing protein [Cnuibacter sp. UC19_7]|uniref:choice-of-anchor D domain-containing protein n=1 Tax=Cnuibacter sp. UC19_7 TaxID=3350166 RepID=UPI0036713C75